MGGGGISCTCHAELKPFKIMIGLSTTKHGIILLSSSKSRELCQFTVLTATLCGIYHADKVLLSGCPEEYLFSCVAVVVLIDCQALWKIHGLLLVAPGLGFTPLA